MRSIRPTMRSKKNDANDAFKRRSDTDRYNEEESIGFDPMKSDENGARRPHESSATDCRGLKNGSALIRKPTRRTIDDEEYVASNEEEEETVTDGRLHGRDHEDRMKPRLLLHAEGLRMDRLHADAHTKNESASCR